MFSNGFPKEWSTLRKLVWLYRTVINAVSAVIKTVIGNPIHILDALAKPVQSLSIALEPIQDLHGYDSPWPSGGNDNKLPSTPSMDTTVNDVRFTSDGNGKYTIVGTATDFNTLVDCSFDAPITLPSSDIYIHLMNNEANSNANLFFFNGATQVAGITFGAVNRIYKLTNLTGATIDKIRIIVGNGQTVNITCTPMLCLDGTAKAFSPYSNICPISGHTDADVTRTGVNVWDEEWETGRLDYDKNSPTWGQNVNVSNAIRSKNYISVFPDTSYYCKSGQTTYAIFYDESKNPVLYGNSGYYAIANALFTAPSSAKYLRFYCTSTSAYANNVSINYPSTDTSYHAYDGTTYPIPLGQTVYGGVVDAVNGKAVVKWGIVAYDGTESMQPNGQTANSTRFYIAVNGKANGTTNLISDRFSAQRTGDAAGRVTGRSSNNGIEFYLPPSVPQTVQGGKDWFTANPTTIVYELAEPFEITLTPTQVELLLGENNLWSDGTMTLVYLADGNASDVEALNILLGGRYVNNHTADEPSDREALDILLGGNTR